MINNNQDPLSPELIVNPAYQLIGKSDDYIIFDSNDGRIIRIGRQEYLYLSDIRFHSNQCEWNDSKKSEAEEFFLAEGVIRYAKGTDGPSITFKPEAEGLFKIRLLKIDLTRFFNSISFFKNNPRVFKALRATMLSLALLAIIAWILFLVQAKVNIVDDYLYISHNILSFIFIYLFSLISVFVHEFGHSASCFIHMRNPGKFGLMLFFLQPVAYVDLTCTYFLNNQKKIAIYTAGVVAQLHFLSILIYLQLLLFYCFDTYCAAITLFVVIDLASVLLNLLPTTKLDGYWLLSSKLHKPYLYNDALGAVLLKNDKKRDKLLLVYGLLIILTESIIWIGTIIIIINYLGRFIDRSMSITILVVLVICITVDQVRRYGKAINQVGGAN